jgi:hypothetical protein
LTLDYPSFENAAVMASLNKNSEFQISGILNLLDLGNILSVCFKFRSCNPRDKVFALLGLVPDRVRKHPLLTADYQKPTREVFRDTTEHILSHCDKPLGILYYAGVGYSDNNEDAPSWARRWKGGEFIGTPLIGPLGDNNKSQNYRAATALGAVIQFESKHVLLLKGIPMDAISVMTSVLDYLIDARGKASLLEAIKAKHS